jgi:ribonucleoside-diphosphate reductase alpha chain
MELVETSQGRENKTRRTGRNSMKGLRVARRFTKPGVEPMSQVEWDTRRSVITNPDGSVVFEVDRAEVPKAWSQLATDVAVSKYFRKAGVPQKDGTLGRETSVRQLVGRVARTLRRSGEEQGGYFATPADADTFEAELTFLLVNQYGAFNSPVWFNCGLWHEYKIHGSGGNFAWDNARQEAVVTQDAYVRPQVSACFIQSLGDDLMSIFELLRNEARVFKYGSGTGTNFSQLRGRMEKLSGGGTSSGLMSFLEVFDRGAGATKSGGTTRRAAKMVVLDMDHPEIIDFIRWKKREEKKAHALISAGYPSDFNGEAYHTVSGQNSNNSVRVTDPFMRAVEEDGTWQTTFRTTREVYETHKARDLWREIAEASWSCADPGVQFDDTIQRWHTCKGTDRIRATNPCSEFVFLDDTACNLASVNLLKFLGEDGSFDVEAYRHACRVFFLAQEIAVDLASYPTKAIAERSHTYRPLGLGYANLGTLLMVEGLAYDSDEARAYAAALTAIMTGEAYALSADMAASKGAFDGYAKNKASMLDVMRLHRDAAYAVDGERCPPALFAAAKDAWDRAVSQGERHGYRNAQATVLAPTGTIGLLMDCDTTGVEPDFALVKFKKLAGGGYFKIVNQSVPRALRKLGYSPNQIEDIVRYAVGTGSLDGATSSADGARNSPAPHVTRERLTAFGLTAAELARIDAALPTVLDLRNAFTAFVLGDEAIARLKIDPAAAKQKGWNLLTHMGFSAQQIAEASLHVCGRMTVEGAPHLCPEHLPVFDCANRCGAIGKRFIAPMGHVRMMAAVQPFISGAISKTVNLTGETPVGEIEDIHLQAWRLGLKAIAVYRDGCKASQPLSTKADEKKVEPAKKEESKRELPIAAAPAASTPKRERRRLPKKRHGFTQEAVVGGHKIFLRTGEYEDGALGEIFIDMHKEGAAYRSMMNSFAIAVSMGLQYGVPLESLVDQFTFTRFDPAGGVQGHPNVKFCTSVLDYVFRVLALEYLGRTDLVQVKPEEIEGETPDTAESASLRTTGSPVTTALSSEPLPQPEIVAADSATAAESAAAEASPGIAVAATAMNTAATNPGLTANAARPANGTRPSRNGKASTRGPNELYASLLGDAPFCDLCGHITVRNGACYRCLNCGHTLGCS